MQSAGGVGVRTYGEALLRKTRIPPTMVRNAGRMAVTLRIDARHPSLET